MGIVMFQFDLLVCWTWQWTNAPSSRSAQSTATPSVREQMPVSRSNALHHYRSAAPTVHLEPQEKYYFSTTCNIITCDWGCYCCASATCEFTTWSSTLRRNISWCNAVSRSTRIAMRKMTPCVALSDSEVTTTGVYILLHKMPTINNESAGRRACEWSEGTYACQWSSLIPPGPGFTNGTSIKLFVIILVPKKYAFIFICQI